MGNCKKTTGFNSTCCDTYPDTLTQNHFDASTFAELQGSNRVQRGINYMWHLRNFYSSNTWPQYGFFEGGHDAGAFGRSKQFSEWVFQEDTAGDVTIAI